MKTNQYLQYIMTYKIKKQNIYLRIINHNFIKYNKYKAKLIIDNRRYDLNEYIPTFGFKEGDTIKIKMILLENILNKKFMFANCESLLELSYYKRFKENRTTKLNEEINIIDNKEEINNKIDINKYNKLNDSTLNEKYNNFYYDQYSLILGNKQNLIRTNFSSLNYWNDKFNNFFLKILELVIFQGCLKIAYL